MIGVFDDGASAPRNPRKHRRIDDDPPDKGSPESMAARATGSTTNLKHAGSMASSYKESLMQNSMIIPSEYDEIIEEEGIIIEEWEVVHGESDGVLSIDFSKRVLSLAVKSLERTVVVQMLKLMDVENDYFLISFWSQDDYR
ncbi:hypothetical protein V6N11_076607 [Hibiscus sabdariffa]|uniref:Uncharacterized protein n=1 Tax=Hibiscus sabdariffa TaxID=183260 RepID=A0ABR2Q6T0_9ROSI